MICQLLDLTADFNTNSGVNIDVSGFDYIIVQLVSPTGTVTFNSTNDAGAITGVTDGNALSATNWVTIQGTNMNTGSGATSIAASSMFRFSYIGHFFQLTGTAVTATKVLIMLSKID